MTKAVNSADAEIHREVNQLSLHVRAY